MAAHRRLINKRRETEAAYTRDTHLSVQVKEIKGEEAHAHLDVFDLYILPFPLAQLLEWHQLARRSIDCHSFCVQHERFRVLLDTLHHSVSEKKRYNPT
jgi:hypothetical protein